MRGKQEFTWETARRWLDGLPDGGLNIAHEAVVRHAARDPDRPALVWVAPDGAADGMTYGALHERICRFANMLERLGCHAGDRVFGVLERAPAQHVAVLGTLKAGMVYSPAFPAFGPEPLKVRLAAGDARVVVTTWRVYERKLAALLPELPHIEHVVLVDSDGHPPAGARDLDAELAASAPRHVTAPTGPKDVALLHFTGGTTGRPKGAFHVHEAVVAQHASARTVFDLGPEDVFWCTADPGWVTGLVYGVVAPLTVGATTVIDLGPFDPVRWMDILENQRVSVWYTTPTAIRLIRRLGEDVAAGRDLSALKGLYSVGEPLDATSVRFGEVAFGRPFRDTWWQTETGAIMIANRADQPVKAGAMGRPVPGVEAAIAEVGPTGARVIEKPDVIGQLVLRDGWPSRFRGYLGDPARTAQAFRGPWYLTGDLAHRDADGVFWFAGRDDDMIKSSGHLVSPFEVESALLAHEAVQEAAAIGRPDAIAGQLVVAHVTLVPDATPSDTLGKQLIGHARKALGAAMAPRDIVFRDSFPRTKTGKIMRRVVLEQDSHRRDTPTEG